MVEGLEPAPAGLRAWLGILRESCALCRLAWEPAGGRPVWSAAGAPGSGRVPPAAVREPCDGHPRRPGAAAAGARAHGAIAVGELGVLRWESRELQGPDPRRLARAAAALRTILDRTGKPAVPRAEAAALAHDLRNRLMLLGLELERAERETGPVNAAARAALDEARALCVGFLADPGAPGLRAPIELRSLLQDELRAAVELAGPHARVALRCPRGLSAAADATSLRRAVHNLVLNALRASPPGGAVRVRAAAGARGVRILVVDRGRGMGQAELEGALRAGSSGSGGTGYGTESLLAAAARLRARVSIRSTPGRGTCCLLALPDLAVGTVRSELRVGPDAVSAVDLDQALAGFAGRPPARVQASRGLPARDLARLRERCAAAGVELEVESEITRQRDDARPPARASLRPRHQRGGGVR